MDDGRLLVMEGLTEKPLLINEKYVTGCQREGRLLLFTLDVTLYSQHITVNFHEETHLGVWPNLGVLTLHLPENL